MSQTVGLRPLHCGGCGALVPLGQGSTARCGYCRFETSIPPEYGALQRAAQDFAANQKLAHQLYGRIGKPPGWFARAWGRGAQRTARYGQFFGFLAFGNPVIAFGLAASAAYALGYPVGYLIRGAYWVAGVPVASKLNTYEVLTVTSILVLFLICIPAVLATKEEELAEARRDIHASLAAGLPERPGGPSRCRSCGAALDVPPKALGVPCPYCGADNLVALPPGWVARVRSSEFRQFLRLDAALEAHRQASIAAQERFWKLALGFVFVFPVVMVVGWLLNKMGISF